MDDLSENNIKKVALALLKQHYRYRPRTGPTSIQQDLRAEGGIIIDGYLSYPREEEGGKPFVATVEATSYPTRDEVRYRIQQSLLSWEASAVAAILVTALFTLLHIRGYYPLFRIGLVNTLSGALVLMLFGHLLYRVLFGRLQRYRYIYAVEQFKQYYADEQWIAVGEDVFRGKEDKNFMELRDQCIFQGFGLIIVDSDLQGHIHITPSRSDLFEGSRRRLSFQTLEEFTRRLPQALKAGPAAKRIGSPADGQAPAAPPKRRRSWMRDPFRFFHQFTVMVLAITLLVSLFYLEWRERPVLVVDEDAYEQQLLRLKDDNEAKSEPLEFLVDTPAVEPFRRRERPYLDLDAIPGRESAPAPEIRPERAHPGLLAIDGQGKLKELPCESLRNQAQARYVIQWDNGPGREPTVDDLRKYAADGFRAMALWTGCFEDPQPKYTLVLAPFYNTKARADRELAAAVKALAAKGYETNLRLRVIPPGE